jgi:hypothetical protein
MPISPRCPEDVHLGGDISEVKTDIERSFPTEAESLELFTTVELQ